MVRLALILVAVAASTAACGPRPPEDTSARLAPAAERYVRLVLAMGAHDKDYVDAYYGPPEWRTEVEASPKTLADIRREADSLAAVADAEHRSTRERWSKLRALHLSDQLRALSARCSMLEGAKLSYDEETRALYGAVAPAFPDSLFERALARLDSMLPGRGPLTERFNAYFDRFIIPKDRVPQVYEAALRETRERTKRHLALPDSERFTIEYVKDKPWGAYNWYKGAYYSVIQVNMDLPIYMSGPIAIAAHEGYPGHHVYNILREQRLVRERGWLEFTVYPLFSPESFVGEGAADYGVDLLFPEPERTQFEKQVLFPLAGLDPNEAERFAEVRRLYRSLRGSGIKAARNYLDGVWTAELTIEWLQSHALTTKDEAKQALDFYDQYRSYGINYTIGEEVVREVLRSRGPTTGKAAWTEYANLLTEPVVAWERSRPEKP